jgi:hypothetical protein
MRFYALAFVLLAACTGAIPESAIATAPAQIADPLPDCSSVAVSPSFWAEPTDVFSENTQYVVLEGDDPVCVTSFQGLELLAERVGTSPNAPTPASNPMPGAPVATPASNPMPGVVPIEGPASTPMPGTPSSASASSSMPGFTPPTHITARAVRN